MFVGKLENLISERKRARGVLDSGLDCVQVVSLALYYDSRGFCFVPAGRLIRSWRDVLDDEIFHAGSHRVGGWGRRSAVSGIFCAGAEGGELYSAEEAGGGSRGAGVAGSRSAFGSGRGAQAAS